MSKVVLFCIAKLEHRYIEEFCKYHLYIGFDTIYIFDNEDVPTYQTLLQHIPNIYVIHFPGTAQQYIAIQCFQNNIMYNHCISHVIHLDCDEFIVLKKHGSIKEFIQEYIKDDCAGIGINWRFFGDSNHEHYSNVPVRKRFTWCEKGGNIHIKTLYNKDHFVKYNTMHDINVKDGYHIKSTTGEIIQGPFNHNIDISVIQINHYKTKTFEEFQYIRQRGRADWCVSETHSMILDSFHHHNRNEVQDFTIFNVELDITINTFLNGRGFSQFEGHCQTCILQVIDLVELTKNATNVMEIGFNAGHSAEILLKYNPSLHLTSFDIGHHNYVPHAKEFIDHYYPERHILILGDSTKTVPEFKDTIFDVIFIDGGNDYSVVNADLNNCKRFANSNTIVILDDTMYAQNWVHPYTIGPTQVWLESINNNIIELGRKDYEEGKGMSWGKYKF